MPEYYFTVYSHFYRFLNENSICINHFMGHYFMGHYFYALCKWRLIYLENVYSDKDDGDKDKDFKSLHLNEIDFFNKLIKEVDNRIDEIRKCEKPCELEIEMCCKLEEEIHKVNFKVYLYVFGKKDSDINNVDDNFSVEVEERYKKLMCPNVPNKTRNRNSKNKKK